MKNLCQKRKVKLILLEASTGCQEPGLLSVWKSLTSGENVKRDYWFRFKYLPTYKFAELARTLLQGLSSILVIHIISLQVRLDSSST